MEIIKRILNKNSWASILESIIFAIFGIILVCRPEGTAKLITVVLGMLFIITGIFKIISYFLSRGTNDIYNYNLVLGLTFIVIGACVMAYINVINSVFRIIIGIWIIYTSFVRINFALQIREYASNVWGYSLILALIMFICGLYIIINSNAIIVSIGIIMIVYAIIDIIETIIFMKNINKIL